jgi:hypothetical protein
MQSGLPKRLAAIGLLIGLTFVLLWWFDRSFNPFGLPSIGETQANFTEPLTRRLFEVALFVLCPGQLFQVFTIGIGGRISWVIWVLLASLNWPIYYVIGLTIEHTFHTRGPVKHVLR